MILLVDNYDSFTYNLVQRLGEIDPARRAESRPQRPDHARRDRACRAHPPDHLARALHARSRLESRTTSSPGSPPQIPLLGVCLGHQCIGHALGARVVRAGRIMHGKTSLIHHDGRGVYRGLANPFEATRYHSLVIEPGTLPEELEVVAWTDQDEIMGVRHRGIPLEGVQFIPEELPIANELLRSLGSESRAPPSSVRGTRSQFHPGAKWPALPCSPSRGCFFDRIRTFLDHSRVRFCTQHKRIFRNEMQGASSSDASHDNGSYVHEGSL